MKKHQQVADLLNAKYEEYNQKGFIADDPISIPHKFSKLQDIEIMGFWVAMLAWGQRKTIIKSANRLLGWMDHAPHDFICNHTENDLKPFWDFKHRTFNDIDALYFIAFLQHHYQSHDSLESAFSQHLSPQDETIEAGLVGFHHYFFSLPDAPDRTKKHVATPQRKSACKRLSMFLRWMARKDDKGVDFGLWENIGTHQLICPLDVHVERVAKSLGLLNRKQTDWQAAKELTATLKEFDAQDPVKYDFALFGLGLEGAF